MKKYIFYNGRIELVERETKTQWININGKKYSKKTKQPVGFEFYWNAPDCLKIINEEERKKLLDESIKRKKIKSMKIDISELLEKEISENSLNEILKILKKKKDTE